MATEGAPTPTEERLGSCRQEGVLDRYKGDKTSKHVKHGKGNYVYDNTFFEYKGEYKSGKKEGKGALVLKDGTVIKGNFVNGEITGVGRKEWRDPNRNQLFFEGDFLNGEIHGRGKLTFRNGDTYKGQFKSNKMHGDGVMVTSNSIYEGQFSESLREGEGKEIWREPAWKYTGNWAKDKFDGFGRLFLKKQLVANCKFSQGFPVQKPHHIHIGAETMEVERGLPLEVACIVLDDKGSPLTGIHCIQLQLTAWYRYRKLPEIPEDERPEGYPKLREAPVVEKSPFYKVVEFPVTSFRNMVQGLEIPAHLRGILSQVGEGQGQGKQATVSKLGEFLMLQRDDNPDELEIHKWPLAPLESITIGDDGYGNFTDFGLPAAQNHDYAPFMVEDFLKAYKARATVTHYFGEKPKVPSEEKGPTRDIDLTRLDPEDAVQMVLAQRSTRAGEYVLRVADITPNIYLERLGFTRMEPQYCKVTVKECIKKPAKTKKKISVGSKK